MKLTASAQINKKPYDKAYISNAKSYEDMMGEQWSEMQKKYAKDAKVV